MPSKNYVKGRNKEYSIRNKLLKEGFAIAQRTAGSHSPVDVFAIHKEKKLILLVQAKPEGYSSSKYDELEWLNGEFTVRFEVR